MIILAVFVVVVAGYFNFICFVTTYSLFMPREKKKKKIIQLVVLVCLDNYYALQFLYGKVEDCLAKRKKKEFKIIFENR